tara:strand:+ start:710 stop:1684 length:975 start_codon:yes stop_codon:yes gene_type:complete
MADPVTTIQRRPDYLELREKALLDAIFGTYDPNTKEFSDGLIQREDLFTIPEYKLAGQYGRDPDTGQIVDFGLETFASQYLQQDSDGDKIPDFMQRTDPYFNRAQSALGAGLGSLSQARNILSSPYSTTAFMNPFQQQVIDEVEADIDRQGLVAQNRAADKAIQAGAFGGSRQGIQTAEIERNILDAKRKATADLRMKNFAQAQKAAQEAGRLIGGIGQSYGTIGTQAADTGRVYGAMTPADLAFMQGVGESERGFRQTVLDTERQEAQRPTEQALLPYNYAYGALSGTPSAGLYTQIQQPTYQTNPVMAGLGAYTTLQGINRA